MTERLGDSALRWYVSEVTSDEIVVEATICDDDFGSLRSINSGSVKDTYFPGKTAVVSIIPTGVGCEIGGYAGDAAPVTNLLASSVDYVITNPNSVNASNFISLAPNVVYTEGLTIDLFCQGLVNLYRPLANRVGLIVERSSDAHLDVIFNVINAIRAIYGVNIEDVVVTDEAIGSRCVENSAGAFVGTIDRPDVLFSACDELLSRGATAIGVTTNVQDLPTEAYEKHFRGEYPNPVGGVEAIISHLITRRYRIPAAHAPLINLKQMTLSDNVVDSRGAGEMSSVSGLACVPIGLRRAPQIDPSRGGQFEDILNINNLLAVVAPASCLGGIPILATQPLDIPVIAVKDNKTILDVTQSRVQLRNCIEVRNYAEASGVLLALKNGISLESIRRPLANKGQRRQSSKQIEATEQMPQPLRSTFHTPDVANQPS